VTPLIPALAGALLVPGTIGIMAGLPHREEAARILRDGVCNRSDESRRSSTKRTVPSPQPCTPTSRPRCRMPSSSCPGA
jgi:hypothetical protein